MCVIVVELVEVLYDGEGKWQVIHTVDEVQVDGREDDRERYMSHART